MRVAEMIPILGGVLSLEPCEVDAVGLLSWT